MLLDFKNGVRNIQTMGYNGVRTVGYLLFGQINMQITFEFWPLTSQEGNEYTTT